MRYVPARSSSTTFGMLVSCFASGPLLGLLLSRVLAPGSELAEVVSIFAFPSGYFVALLAWLGFGVLAVALGTLRSLLRGRKPGSSEPGSGDVIVPPGAGAFVIFGSLFAAGAGVIAAASSERSALLVMATYLAAGLGYGWALRALAYRGYLPFPEPTLDGDGEDFPPIRSSRFQGRT